MCLRKHRTRKEMKQMEISLDESFFGKLYPYVTDPNVTDIRWNGRALWIEDLYKGRFKTEDVLDESFLKIMTQRIATLQNVNFNASESSLEASTDQLRIHAIHPFRTGEGKTILAIRKTPTVARITDESMIETKYADEKVRELLGALVRAHCSGIIIGDTGAGKTELEKYLATAGIPDPDLLIRTSGEERLSNYMLWQTAYTEFYFTDVLWPDFRKTEFQHALDAFSRRERRFGKI